MDVRRPSRGSREIEGNRLILVLDIDQLRRISRSRGAPGYDDCHDLASEVDLLPSDRVVLRDMILGRELPPHGIGPTSSARSAPVKVTTPGCSLSPGLTSIEVISRAR